MFDVETMDLFPRLEIVAGHNDHRRRGMHHVSIGATSKRQIVAVTKACQIGEGVVLAVMEHTADVSDSDFGTFACEGPDLWASDDQAASDGCQQGSVALGFASHVIILLPGWFTAIHFDSLAPTG
jgi:hypothetical protein